MDEIKPEVVERYQKIFEQDPRSKVFAPLAEAYRKMGLLKEAQDLAHKGVQLHPHFAGGRVALARVYYDQKDWNNAILHLTRATELAPENALAHSLLAEAYLYMKKPKEALKSYKKLLFLNPENEKAQKAVQKLESLTADEYEKDVFSLKPIQHSVKEWDDIQIHNPNEETRVAQLKTLERLISLADAYIVRNDHERALEALNEAERLFGAQTEVVKRLKIIHQRNIEPLNIPLKKEDLKPTESREVQSIDNQIKSLKSILSALQHKRV